MEITEKNQNLLKETNEVYAKYNIPVLKSGFAQGGSDAAYTTIAGIPTIDSIGIDGGRIHSTEEFMYLDSLKEAAKRVAVVIKEMS